MGHGSREGNVARLAAGALALDRAAVLTELAAASVRDGELHPLVLELSRRRDALGRAIAVLESGERFLPTTELWYPDA